MTSSSPQRVPARRRLMPALVLTVVASLVTCAFALADSAPAPAIGGEAVKYLPPEGFVTWSLETGSERDIRHTTEHTRSTGVTAVLALPQLQASVVLELLGETARTTPFWRETTHTLDSEGTRILNDLYFVSEAGVSLIAGHGGDLGWVYDPPMVQLPADVRAGAEWSGRGEAVPLGIVRYEQDARALAPTDAHLVDAAARLDIGIDECLQVNSEVLLTDDTDAELVEIVQRELWCEGRGRVASVAEFAGETKHFSSVEPSAAARDIVAATRSSEWADVASWSARGITVNSDDPFFGTAERTVSLLDTPRVTASGLVVVPHASTNDLLAFSVDGDRLVEEWLVHPGGAIVTVGTVGDVTIVSTSLRELVAYDARGHRLWQAPLAELVLAPPTPTSDGRVVTAGLDGAITVRDAVTGEEQWSRALASDIDRAAVISDGRVLAIDRAGTITSLDAETGEVLWSRSSQPAAVLRALDGFVVSVGDDGWLRTFDAETGNPAHAWRYQGASRALLSIDGVPVLATDEHVIAVDLESGAELWRSAGVSAAVTDGHSLFAVRGTEASMVSARGEPIAKWAVPASFVWAHQYLVAAADRVLIMHSGTSATMVAAP